MDPIKFKEHNIVIAEDQKQYRPLPAHTAGDYEGTLTFCWRLSWKERLKVFMSGVMWHQVMTFNGPLQPQLPLATKPELPAFIPPKPNEHSMGLH